MAMSSELPETPAVFEDVSPREVRCPSWVAKQSKKAPAVSAPRGGRLPHEFVVAFQREIKNASEAPPPAVSLAPSPRLEPTQRDLAAPEPPAPESHRLLSLPAPEPDPQLVQALCDAVEQLGRARAEILAQTGSQLAELAATIARRVLARELSVDARVIHGLVAEGLEALGEHDRISVQLGTGFVDLVQEIEQRLSRSGRSVEVRVDASLGSWGCVVETDLGVVDESVDARLSTLLAALKPDSSPPEG